MVARARKTDNATLRSPLNFGAERAWLCGVDRELFEHLRQETAGQAVRMVYDKGELEIAPKVLHGISWDLYEELLNSAGGKYLRMTYDRGELEFMSPQPKHEKYKIFIRMLVDELARELDLELTPFGSMTVKRRDLERGLEPDECYYVAHAKAMWAKMDLDFAVDPPPDLAIEIDNTNSSVDRQGVYAALGVPELWRHDCKTFQVFHLVKGKYVSKRKSKAFPMLPIQEFGRFVKLGETLGQREWIAKFQKWIRAELKK